MGERVRALRGAITVEDDTREQVIAQTGRLLQALMEGNDVRHDDLVSIMFTATPDIRSEFPAAAAREIGIKRVPLICARELDIEGAVPRCIRILLTFYTERDQEELRPVYLDGARPLRADLADLAD